MKKPKFDTVNAPLSELAQRSAQDLMEAGEFFVTNPAHGGKVTCHKCCGYIKENEHEGCWYHQHRDEFPAYCFHKQCFNPYEHYYGIDRPID